MLFIRAIPPHGRNYRMCLTMTGRLELFNRWCFLFKMQKSTCNPPTYFLTLHVWPFGKIFIPKHPCSTCLLLPHCDPSSFPTVRWDVGSALPGCGGKPTYWPNGCDYHRVGKGWHRPPRSRPMRRGRHGGKISPKPRWQQKDSSERAIVTPLWGGEQHLGHRKLSWLNLWEWSAVSSLVVVPRS